MKSQKGMGLIQLAIFVVIIIFIVSMIVYFVRLQYNKVQIDTVKTDMLQVQWKIKDYIDTQTVNSDEITYLGTKLSENLQDAILANLINSNVIPESEYEKYYVLKDADLSAAGLGITNYKESYFLVNYDNYEIIISKGCEISDDETLYKLSDIEKRTEDNQNTNEVINQTTNEIVNE